MSNPTLTERAAWASAFAHPDFRRFQTARWASIVGTQMQSVAIGWQVYAITRRPIDLAWVGLAQFLPAMGLSLITGHAADRFDRRSILLVCHGAMTLLSLALLVVTRAGGADLSPIYGVLVGIGAARAFRGPANQSILPTLIPAEDFGNAVAWSSTLWQVATVFGPMLGGFVYVAAGGAEVVYGISATCSLAALGLVST
ncbi:MAG: MFS transporter, partial [Polyangiaceae bacterium]